MYFRGSDVKSLPCPFYCVVAHAKSLPKASQEDRDARYDQEEKKKKKKEADLVGVHGLEGGGTYIRPGKNCFSLHAMPLCNSKNKMYTSRDKPSKAY